jgi:hypothetical protein
MHGITHIKIKKKNQSISSEAQTGGTASIPQCDKKNTFHIYEGKYDKNADRNSVLRNDVFVVSR